LFPHPWQQQPNPPGSAAGSLDRLSPRPSRRSHPATFGPPCLEHLRRQRRQQQVGVRAVVVGGKKAGEAERVTGKKSSGREDEEERRLNTL